MIFLYISEIVGKPGIWCIKTMIPFLKREFNPDLTVINVNSATGGNGIGKQHAGYLHKLGGDVLTSGYSVFLKKDLCGNIDKIPYLIRPANLPDNTPGKGFIIKHTENRQEAAVISFTGTFSPSRLHGENPFSCFSKIIGIVKKRTPFILVDLHALMTAEKRAFFYHAEGKVSAVIGSGGKIQTTDGEILPGGTAVITDAGRTGSQISVGGNSPKPKIFEYLTGVPDWTRECWTKPAVQGVCVTTDGNGKAVHIQTFTRKPEDFSFFPCTGDKPDSDREFRRETQGNE